MLLVNKHSRAVCIDVHKCFYCVCNSDDDNSSLVMLFLNVQQSLLKIITTSKMSMNLTLSLSANLWLNIFFEQLCTSPDRYYTRFIVYSYIVYLIWSINDCIIKLMILFKKDTLLKAHVSCTFILKYYIPIWLQYRTEKTFFTKFSTMWSFKPKIFIWKTKQRKEALK